MSLSAGVNSWNDIFADRNVINCGYGWDRLGNMMWRMMHQELTASTRNTSS